MGIVSKGLSVHHRGSGEIIQDAIRQCFWRSATVQSSTGKHLRALHSVVESWRLFSTGISCDLGDRAHVALPARNLPPENDEDLANEPDFIATLDGQR